MKSRKNISLSKSAISKAKVLHDKHGVNISLECEKAILKLAEKFKVK